MSEENKNDATDETAAETESASEAEAPESETQPKKDGPEFTEAPSPLDGVTKATKDVWEGMEG